jgi:hypothetical protein
MPNSNFKAWNKNGSSTPELIPENRGNGARKKSLNYRKHQTTIEKITFEKLDLKKEKSVSFIDNGKLDIGGSIGGSSR